MGRSAQAGTDAEFKGNISTRWRPSGGSSCKRYRSAVESIDAWHEHLKRCEFTTINWDLFLMKAVDEPGHVLYCDPPFPDAGDRYKHPFDFRKHRALAGVLGSFKNLRVVCRFHDHPLVRDLYPKDKWTWRRMAGRDQHRQDKDEVLIINGPSTVQS